MGKSITPKYRIHVAERNPFNGRNVINQMAWRGKASEKNLSEYITQYINSLKIGGVNEQISKMLGYIPVPNEAWIINQKTGETVVTWKAPKFMEI